MLGSSGFLFAPASNCKGIQNRSARGRPIFRLRRSPRGRRRAQFRDAGNHMTRIRGATIVFAALVAAAAFPGAARAECYLENVASPQEIAGGWTIHEDLRVVKQVDSAPYEQGDGGNWFVDRETTTLPLCSVFDDLGAYSLRPYMLQPVVTKVQVKICQATAGGGSVPFVPADAKPQPSDTAHEVFDSYKRPYAGPCPPVRPAPVPVPRSRKKGCRRGWT